ncbi:MAG: DUF47 family protein [Bacteroidota bacterium]
MGLNRIFQILVPKDKKFIPLFVQGAENLVDASLLLKEAFVETDLDKRSEKVRRIKDLEHKGDEITHTIFNELNRNFITPFDREDIQHLTSSLDDVLDLIDGAARRIMLYKLSSFSKEFISFADLIIQCAEQIKIAIIELDNLKHPENIKKACILINSYENDADDLYHQSISGLFDTETDPILLIKKRDILNVLEGATDKAEDVSDVLKSIIVKVG